MTGDIPELAEGDVLLVLLLRVDAGRAVLALALQRVEQGRVPEAQRVPDGLLAQVDGQVLLVGLAAWNVHCQPKVDEIMSVR